MGEVQWEAEFFALQDSNNKLAGALREANAAAAQWRQQLEAQRAEAERLRQRVRGPLPYIDSKRPRATLEPLPLHVLSVLGSPTGCVISAGHFPVPQFYDLYNGSEIEPTSEGSWPQSPLCPWVDSSQGLNT